MSQQTAQALSQSIMALRDFPTTAAQQQAWCNRLVLILTRLNLQLQGLAPEQPQAPRPMPVKP